MDGVITDVRLMNCTDHMEMNRVGAKDEGLADHRKLNTVNAADSRFIARRVADDDGTVLVVGGVFRVTAIHNIASQQTDFCAHLDSIRAERLDTSVMLGEKRSVESDDGVGINGGDRFDSTLLSVTAGVSSRGNDNLLTDLPVK